jgi:bifunctional non-homologous end joining protein LigD
VTWDEVERALKKKDASLLVFEAPQVVERFEKRGDLFEPMLELKQKLPELKAAAAAIAKEPIEIAAQAEERRPARKPARKSAPPKAAASPMRKKRSRV